MKNQLLFLLIFLIASCQPASAPTSTSSSAQQEQLHQIFKKEWAFRTNDNPPEDESWRSGVLPNVTPEAQQKKAAYWKNTLEQLAQIDRNQLDKKDQINYDIFKYQLEDMIARIEFEDYLIPINSEGGFYMRFAHTPNSMLFEGENNYEDYLKKLEAFPKYMDDHIGLLRLGIEKGITQPKVILKNYKALLQPLLVDETEESGFFRPFQNFPNNIPTEKQNELKKRGKDAIANMVLPAYQKFDEFMEEEYIPQARNSLGVSELPNGKAYYEQRVQFFTTLPVTSNDIFETGKKEVARIRAEMEQIIKDLNFKGDFAAFLKFLRTDPQFYAKTPRQLLMEASYLSKKMDGKLPEYFNTLPRLPYGVQPVPAAIAPNYTGGRYSGGSLEGHQAGNYWVNTYKLESRPLYVLPALTLHEAVPGHHLQISIAQELEGFPEFRRNTYLSCYGEGWGLYSEYLGVEAGMYETPYEDFGRLTYEMWRACRLVVDVGLHAKGWTRERAVDFLASNTALSLHEVNTEIDRYIGWAGQALSYKMGELKIRELRQKAETALGEKFNIREFHDVILLNGAVPLFVLEDLVEGYIEGKS